MSGPVIQLVEAVSSALSRHDGASLKKLLIERAQPLQQRRGGPQIKAVDFKTMQNVRSVSEFFSPIQWCVVILGKVMHEY